MALRRSRQARIRCIVGAGQHRPYAVRELNADMVELHDALGGTPAVWVDHDWGSPVVWEWRRTVPNGAGRSRTGA